MFFGTLDDFAAGRPAIWRQAFGSPATQFGVTSFGAFLQNRWRLNASINAESWRCATITSVTTINLPH